MRGSRGGAAEGAAMEILATMGMVGAVGALAGLGMAALPWTEGELDASEAAWGALPELVRLPGGLVRARAGGLAVVASLLGFARPL